MKDCIQKLGFKEYQSTKACNQSATDSGNLQSDRFNNINTTLR